MLSRGLFFVYLWDLALDIYRRNFIKNSPTHMTSSSFRSLSEKPVSRWKVKGNEKVVWRLRGCAGMTSTLSLSNVSLNWTLAWIPNPHARQEIAGNEEKSPADSHSTQKKVLSSQTVMQTFDSLFILSHSAGEELLKVVGITEIFIANPAVYPLSSEAVSIRRAASYWLQALGVLGWNSIQPKNYWKSLSEGGLISTYPCISRRSTAFPKGMFHFCSCLSVLIQTL